jgi:peptidoglycan/xylan/chitin deacetylase (PgdA/CDA1 family)
MKTPVFLYHQIADIGSDKDPYRLSVTPEQFDRQMAYLNLRAYHCLPLATMIKAQLTGDRLTRKTFAITFDDGYRDNFEVAMPILLRYKFTATIFLVADWIGQPTNWEGQSGDKAFPLMNWDEIREMQAQGFHFGSHTRTHPRLDELSPEQVEWELRSSKQILEEGLGRQVELLAYPYEGVNLQVQKIAEQVGYIGACGRPPLEENRFNIWRNQIHTTDTLGSFGYKASRLWHRYINFRYRSPITNALRGIRRGVRG